MTPELLEQIKTEMRQTRRDADPQRRGEAAARIHGMGHYYISALLEAIDTLTAERDAAKVALAGEDTLRAAALEAMEQMAALRHARDAAHRMVADAELKAREAQRISDERLATLWDEQKAKLNAVAAERDTAEAEVARLREALDIQTPHEALVQLKRERDAARKSLLELKHIACDALQKAGHPSVGKWDTAYTIGWLEGQLTDARKERDAARADRAVAQSASAGAMEEANNLRALLKDQDRFGRVRGAILALEAAEKTLQALRNEKEAELQTLLETVTSDTEV